MPLYRVLVVVSVAAALGCWMLIGLVGSDAMARPLVRISTALFAGVALGLVSRFRVPAAALVLTGILFTVTVLSGPREPAFSAGVLAACLLALVPAVMGPSAKAHDCTNRVIIIAAAWVLVIAIGEYVVLRDPVVGAPALLAIAAIVLAAHTDRQTAEWLAEVRAGKISGWTIAPLGDPRVHSGVRTLLVERLGHEPPLSALVALPSAGAQPTLFALVPRDRAAWSALVLGLIRGVGLGLLSIACLALLAFVAAAAAMQGVR